MGSPINTIASDFAYIASLDGLQVNAKCMWTKINKQRPQPFSQKFNWPSVHTALTVSGHLGVQIGWPWPRWGATVSQIKSKNTRVSQTIDRKGRWPDEIGDRYGSFDYIYIAFCPWESVCQVMQGTFSQHNVATNVAKTFLALIDKHFPKDKRLRKIFNRNTIKVSYSCLPNVKQTISNNNHLLLQLHSMKESTQDSKLCNCRQKNSCPLDGKCLTKRVVYKPTVTETTPNNQETYIWPTENEFKTRFNLHKSSFKWKHKRTSATLSEHVWKLKKKHQLQHQMEGRQKSEAITIKW